MLPKINSLNFGFFNFKVGATHKQSAFFFNVEQSITNIICLIILPHSYNA